MSEAVLFLAVHDDRERLHEPILSQLRLVASGKTELVAPTGVREAGVEPVEDWRAARHRRIGPRSTAGPPAPRARATIRAMPGLA